MQTFIPPFGLLSFLNPLMNNVFKVQFLVPGTPFIPTDERITNGDFARLTDGGDDRVID